jgi:hypothetical protein
MGVSLGGCRIMIADSQPFLFAKPRALRTSVFRIKKGVKQNLFLHQKNKKNSWQDL